MSTKQQISQQQGQRQQLKLSQQQLIVAGLLEGSIVELEEKVKKELESNPALEESHDRYGDEESDYGADEKSANDFQNDGIGDGSEPVGPSVDEGVYVDVDEIPDTYTGSGGGDSYIPDDYNSAYADGQDFSEYLISQLDSIVSNDKQREIGHYLIGSLDENGFLADLPTRLTDDINTNGGIEVSISEVVEVIAILQSLDPAGVGARNIAESLRLQAERNMTGDFNKDFIPRCAVAILDEAFEDLTKKKYDSILRAVEVERGKEGVFSPITREEMVDAIAYIRGLNPHPCQIITESRLVRGTDSIIPDFHYDSELGKLTVNSGKIPSLTVNSEYKSMLEDIEKQKKNGIDKKDGSEVFLRDRIEAAQQFIDALDQRNSILTKVMTAILKVQREFFNQGCDDSLLKPLTMKQIADEVGCDISTVSRVAGSKYISVDGQYTFKIKHFFSEKISTESGDLVSNKTIMEIIRTLVASEDKSNPLTDEAIAVTLQKKGYNVARRTVAKYRIALNIPSTRERSSK